MGFHIVKRENCPLWKKVVFYLGAIAIALVLGAVILLAIGVDPITYYTRMFTMGLGSDRYPFRVYMNFLFRWVPLALTALGLSLAFKMRFWNIGGEGQFIMGALAASAAAFLLEGKAPQGIILLTMCLAAVVVAGLFGLMVAALKVKFNTNETLLTLMLNYVALYVLTYLMNNKTGWNIFLREEASRPTPRSVPKDALFPGFSFGGKFELSLCVILTLVIAVMIYIYLKHTKQGYEINVVGDSPGTARYAGMKTGKIVLRTVFLSASLVGLAAAFTVGMGTGTSLSVSITNEVGWTGIIVAWLSQLNTWAILVVSALINLLHLGSDRAATAFQQVDASFANMLQGFLLFLVLAADFMIRFKFLRTKKEGNHG